MLIIFLKMLYKYIFNSAKLLRSLRIVSKQCIRYSYQESFTSGATRGQNAIDTHYKHYLNLKLPPCKIFATYIWIDGSGIHMRSKDRILEEEPCNISDIPKWSFDGSSTGLATTENSDVVLLPVALYRDPFKKCPHVLVLCETLHSDGTPTRTNHRANCVYHLNQISDQDPQFGIEQEYSMFDENLWPLGWPKARGFPGLKHEFSYCGVGEYVVGRDVVDCHAMASVYAGMDYEGSNAEVMKSSWEYQVGAQGIKAADDLWLGRYLLARIGEQFGVTISYHPKPMGPDQPGIGCHHNFSIEKWREDNGLAEIEKMNKLLCDQHEKCIHNYGLGNGEENKKRLTGKFETAAYDSCRWGVADRGASVRLQRNVLAKGKGFLEDRRPAGDCDPYRVCAILAELCTQLK